MASPDRSFGGHVRHWSPFAHLLETGGDSMGTLSAPTIDPSHCVLKVVGSWHRRLRPHYRAA